MAGSIWTIEKRLWPQAASEYVFLAAAFDEVGNALFPEWTGDEAKAVSENALAEGAAAARCHAVVEMIAHHGRNATFRTLGLAVPGGASLVTLGPGIWNRANDWDLFAHCRFHQVLVPRHIETDYDLFLTRDGLSRAIMMEQSLRRIEANPELAFERRVSRCPEPPQHRARGATSISFSSRPSGIRKPFRTPDDLRTGDPGRPAKMPELYMEELQRRATVGELESGIAAQARALLIWLRENHPGRESYPDAGTIRNRIRKVFWTLSGRTK